MKEYLVESTADAILDEALATNDAALDRERALTILKGIVELVAKNGVISISDVQFVDKLNSRPADRDEDLDALDKEIEKEMEWNDKEVHKSYIGLTIIFIVIMIVGCIHEYL